MSYSKPIEFYWFLQSDSPLRLGASCASDRLVAVVTLMPATEWHINGFTAGVHAADRGVAPCTRAPGVARAGAGHLLAAPCTSNTGRRGGVQEPSRGHRVVSQCGVRVWNDHRILQALCGSHLLRRFTTKKSEGNLDKISEIKAGSTKSTQMQSFIYLLFSNWDLCHVYFLTNAHILWKN